MLEDNNIKHQASILIIDASTEDLKVLGNVLKQRGFDVLIATSSEQGLKLAINKKPSLILLDVSLVGDEKQNPYADLKQNHSTSTIPIIFTASDSKDLVLGNTNYDDIIWKSIDEVELVNRIKNHILISAYKKTESTIKNIIEQEVKKHIGVALNCVEKNETSPELVSCIQNIALSVDKINKLVSASEDSESRIIQETSINEKNNSKTILIIEDNELNQVLLDSILTDAGYKTHIESTGKGAVDALKRHTVNLVLMDVNLPDMSCSEIYSEMRNSGYDIPIVAVSGYTKSEIIEKNPELPFADFILKPVKADVLCNVIEKHSAKLFNVGQKEYDYSRAKKIAAGDDAELKKWMDEFVSFLKKGEAEIKSLLEGKIAMANREVTHGLLSYTVFFGAIELKDLILELKDMEKDQTKKPSTQLLNTIAGEIKSLLQFYNKIEIAP